MHTIEGKYNTALVYADTLEEKTRAQIKELCDQKFTEGSQIRIMPDCHAGKGCVIGTTMTIRDKIVPNLVGVDIGCGMKLVKLGHLDLDYQKVDDLIHEKIPAGLSKVNETALDSSLDLTLLDAYPHLIKTSYLSRSLGSLGGGNHFIEIDQDEEGCLYLIIHTGSRNLGTQIASYYQNLAIFRQEVKDGLLSKAEITSLTAPLSEDIKRGTQRDRRYHILKSKFASLSLPHDLCYLEGEDFRHYLHDMDLCQKFAVRNRHILASRIVSFLSLELDHLSQWECIHNYIDLDHMILRKGSISAMEGEPVIIPMNMRDGTVLGYGKGDEAYNYSAPHGAGRKYSRKAAKQAFTLADFKASMKGIYTTSVVKETLDESPFAYKSEEEILANIKDTVKVEKILKPVYNFKAAD